VCPLDEALLGLREALNNSKLPEGCCAPANKDCSADASEETDLAMPGFVVLLSATHLHA
jgi:hypothetical protein